MNNDIEQALTHFRARAERYGKTERYYNGDHDLAFATEKFENTFGTLFREFALNLCPVICDALRDKLRVTGFSTESRALGSRHSAVGFKNTDSRDSADSIDSAARSIWLRNRMGTRAGEVHKEALRSGDAYLIVWPDDAGRACLYPNRAANICVVYDDDMPGRILWAAKYWLAADKHIRLNLFYPDRIEKYISKTESEGTLPDARGFHPLGSKFRVPSSVLVDQRNSEPETRNSEPFAVANPYGVVPVFHFANNADVGSTGRSELEAAIPVQDGLNKSVLDMLVAMEFSAYRQRWAAGIEIAFDAEGNKVAPFKAGIEHLWIAENPQARFGDFEAAQLDQFLKVKDSFRIDMASVTGTPLNYFLQNTSGFASGVSLRQNETRFLAKVRDRQGSFGQVWADAVGLALAIEGKTGTTLITEWEDPSPMSDRELLENLLLKTRLGLPVEQALIEAGYGAADVKTMVE